MFKRNRRKRELDKFNNKHQNLFKGLFKAYLKGKGGKALYNMATMKDIEHLTILALDHMIKLRKENL